MYLIEDESFTELLGGEFYQVILAKKKQPSMSIAKLFNFQFKYDTYDGFRKFYQRHLGKLIEGIRLIDDDSISGKAIRFIANKTSP